jgi:hypothetical protein
LNIQNLADKTLLIDLVETTKQGLSSQLTPAGLVGRAAADARSTILRVSARIAPLYQRTFPNLKVIAAEDEEASVNATVDVVAGSADLITISATREEALASCFQPMVPNPQILRELRSSYLDGEALPLVGLSWWSTHYGKDIPSLKDWADFLTQREAKFVSLQYGDIGGDIRVLQTGARHPIIVDRSVDQMTDMDRFAAQVASLDAVVSISNTAAHVAGILGVPTIVIIDDRLRRDWPVRSTRTPFYPDTIVISARGRPWSAVLNEVSEQLGELLDKDV